ncbi:hypothetical protein BJ138DRAFT_997487 [Hygrophoropsis aurantiaca]|uniref:Uncharacterized protein n=1 Tax=Hygrophoropsis aurantiaca TaxID=72124 RepID=A0ACB8AQU1_9AGAM|nr:hypothetical protein BJ138DRAFT_997487 [Hygrophoropsis aurantiaca]
MARATHSRTPDTSSLGKLKAFLSSENLTSSSPQLHTANTIRSLYMSVKARGQIGQLDPAMLTFLISLFGTLSSTPLRPCVYTNSFMLHMEQSPLLRTYWPFLVTVARDKEHCGMSLSSSDQYWLMCAEIAKLRRLTQDVRSELNSQSIAQSLAHASTHYRHIRSHTADPEVHVAYLDALLSTRDPVHLEIAAHNLSRILRSHRFCHFRLLAVLWSIVLQDGHRLSRQSQLRLLDALWFRITNSREDDETTRLSALDDDRRAMPTDTEQITPVMASHLADILRDTLFTDNNTITNQTRTWARFQLRSIFTPDRPVEYRWRSLLLIALFNIPSMTSQHKPPGWQTHHPPILAEALWELIFGIATIERALKDPMLSRSQDMTFPTVISKTAQQLMQAWLNCTSTHRAPAFVMRPILITLFRVASATMDYQLFDTCNMYCSSAGLWQISEDSLSRPQIIEMASQSLITEIWLGRISDLSWIINLATGRSVVEQLPEDDASATELPATGWTTGLFFDRDISVEVSFNVAIYLARNGRIGNALSFLKDIHFPPSQVAAILRAVARSLTRHRLVHLSSEALHILTNSLHRHCQESPFPPAFRPDIQRLLLLLCQSSSARPAIRIIRTVMRNSATYFQPAFFPRCIRALLEHRHIGSAVQLLKVFDTHRGAQRRQTIQTPAQMGNSVKPTHIAYRHVGRAFRSHIGSSSFDNVYPHLSATTRSLKLASSATDVLTDPVQAKRVMRAHVQAGRFLAAKKLFEQVATLCSNSSRTSLGNSLLHGILLRPSPRNGKQLKKVNSLLMHLVRNHSFAPDRVTFNILLKAIMRWRSTFNHTRLRFLFDHIIRNGYPGGRYSAQHLPFGTETVHSGRVLGIHKLQSLISFEQHVRPLCKMFIKAFYLHGDHEAARTVLEILKTEQLLAFQQTMKRSQAQRAGRLKAEARGTI